MLLKIPKLSLVVLMGPSGSGKSTFGRTHFLPTEVLSSDAFRGWVSDDSNSQEATNDAFEALHFLAAKRLARGRLTVIDATNVERPSRAQLVALARKHHVLPVAIVFDVPESVCHERNRSRPDRPFGPHVVKRQRDQLRKSLRGLKEEGFRQVHVLDGVAAVESAVIEREPLWNDLTHERGPFDVIGDVHGCADELIELLGRLGYEPDPPAEPSELWGSLSFRHPAGRKAVFVGDLVDRGPRVLDSLRIVRNMVQSGAALCVPGNHDVKLLKKLRGRDVKVNHGLAQTLAEIEALPEAIRERFCLALAQFIDRLVSHYLLDEGRLVVAHAGLRENMQGRGSAAVRDFALYGETSGEIDEFGLPVRARWAESYRGRALVVFGHVPVPEPEWLNNTIDIDTGCVFGGKLTALRYPEKEFVSVAAARVYCEPARPFLPADVAALTAQQTHDDALDAADVIGKRIIATRLHRSVTIREENAAAALEVMSRFAIDPKWLIYLPPTMSPSETSSEPGYLEHPAEALKYFVNHGAPRVVCEEKHMGSRAVVVVCEDAESARARFGVIDGSAGAVYTRTGRTFFTDRDLETRFLERVRTALGEARIWDEFNTTWACLDCELMPWSAKAQSLLRDQYAAVGASGNQALPSVVAALEAASLRLTDDAQASVAAALDKFRRQTQHVAQFTAAYRQYCWPVESLDDLKLAPFHLLATEGRVHTAQHHLWHMETLAKVAACDPGLLLATRHRVVDLTDPGATTEAVAWWCEMTERGGEGMVVKPFDFVVGGSQGLLQPAAKCRGREYLRIIYGPDYTADENLSRLRQRALGAKRSLALREFALGIEGLERFARREPLRKVHECVFGVLALESEPVDPRL